MGIASSFQYSMTLTQAERQQLSQLIASLEPLDFKKQHFSRETFAQVERCSRLIPDRLFRHLYQFRNEPNEEGVAHIKNLPIDEPLPSTPLNHLYHNKSSTYSEWLLMLLMSCIANVVGYQEEMQGRYVHDIVPRPSREQVQENSGSVWLEFHTEHGFHPCRQDYIGLLCLRPDHDRRAYCLSASVKHALRHLDLKTIQTLQKPWFQVYLPASFSGAYQQSYLSPPMAVLSEDTVTPRMVADFDAMHAMNSKAQHALQRFEQALESVVMGDVLQPGEMLLVDNEMAAHARTHFTPRYDGYDRWLQRISGIRDLHRRRQSLMPDSHIFRPVIQEPNWRDVIQQEQSACQVS